MFNIVASVKFNELLEDSIDINLHGTKKVVDLALKLKKLQAFVHVSTLFSNCNRSEIDEKLYKHTLNYYQLAAIANILKNVNDRPAIESALLEKLPNTYTLTKHFAEKLVAHRAFYIPCGIFRAPIVISNYQDFPGYTGERLIIHYSLSKLNFFCIRQSERPCSHSGSNAEGKMSLHSRKLRPPLKSRSGRLLHKCAYCSCMGHS